MFDDEIETHTVIKHKKVDRFIFYEQKKTGKFGRVYRVKNSEDGKIYAMKLIPIPPPQAAKYRENINREILNMRSINSDYVVKLKGKGSTENNIYLLMEYCNLGDLQDYCSNNKITLAIFKRICKQILMGIKALHDKNIIHRDIKFGNIVLHKDRIKGVVAKLCDLGISRMLDENQSAQTYCGSLEFLAPEVKAIKDNLSNESYGVKVDIWSLGILFLFFSYKLPKEGTNIDIKRDSQYYIKQMKVPPWSELYDDNIFQDMLTCCIQNDPNLRSSASELLNHNFFKNIV